MTDELDYIAEPEIKLNTSVCRMCIRNGLKRASLPLITGPYREGGKNIIGVRCPNGGFAYLDESAPDDCLYSLEQAVLQNDPVPLPIIDGDD